MSGRSGSSERPGSGSSERPGSGSSERPGSGSSERPGDAFAAMPLVLKGVTSFFAVFGAGSLLLLLAPGTEPVVAGEPLSRAEFWSRGFGPAALVLGLWLSVTAFGLLRRAAWARWAAVLTYLWFVPIELAVREEPRVLWQLALATGWAGGIGAYLFRTGAGGFFTPPPARAH